MYKLDPQQESRRLEISAAIDRRQAENARLERQRNYSYPKTAAEWWNNVDNWWVELLDIFSRFLLMGSYEDINHNFLSCPLFVHIEKLKKDRNVELSRYFNAAWAAAPDHGSIHGIAGWHVLCDLCSEDFVLFEPTEDLSTAESKE